MTTEQYKKLREFADKYEESRHGYVRATKTDMDRFSVVYKEVYGREVNRSQRTCPHCIFKLFKTVAEDFWAFEKTPAGKKLLKREREGNDADAQDNE